MRSRPLYVGVLSVAGLVVLSGCNGSDDPPTSAPIPIVGSPTAVALASPSAVMESATLNLDGSASSDSAGETLSYLWEQTMGPTLSIVDPTSPTTTATVPEVNENRAVTLQLTVTNENGIQSVDTVFATIIDGGVAPIAVAGPDQTVSAGDTVTLDGSSSSDADGEIRNYIWERVIGPVVSISDSASPVATFVAPEVTEPSTVLIRLTVTDADGISAQDELVVTLNPVPAQLAFVEAAENALRNTPLAPLAVEVQNAAGERITEGAGADAEITLTVSSGSGMLTGPTVFTAAEGQAPLSSTGYDSVEAAVELSASSPGLTAGTLTLDIIWPSAFPRVLPGTLRVGAVTQLPNGAEPPSDFDDVVVLYTANGSVDLDLSNTTPESISTDGDDVVLVRYQNDGAVLWFRHFDAADDQRAVTLRLTSDGDLVVLFELNGTVDIATEPPAQTLTSEGTQNVGVLRINGSDGTTEWGTRFGGPAEAVATDLALATNDDPLIVGWFDGSFDPDPSANEDLRSSDGEDGFALRLSNTALAAQSGDLLTYAQTPSASGDDRLTSVALGSNDDLAAGGSQNSDASAWIYRLDAQGVEGSGVSFTGDGVIARINDIESQGSSIQVVGTLSGDSDFGGTEVV
ncbi:MAG: PKD domain-containing protein, partial [Myxococcota bacterium]